MARSYENYCVGCPQGCINCGRDRDVLVIRCDKCDTNIWEDEIFWGDDGNEYCEECYDELYGEDEEDEGEDE